ncbi:MAG: hypothetical protein P8Z49_03365 [Acidobacteriota bacterium]
MTSNWNAAFTHARVLLVSLFRRPASFVIMLIVAGATALIWPGLAAPGGPWFGIRGLGAMEAPLLALFVGLVYLYLWPMVTGLRAAGGAAGLFSVGDGNVALALPALPIGPKGRMAGEILVVYGFVAAVRGLTLPFLASADRAAYAADTLSGALVMLPILLCWAKATGNFDVQSGMAFVVILLELGAQKAGLLAGWWGLVFVSLVLSAVVLWFNAASLRKLRMSWREETSGASRVRPALEPVARYRRDLVLMPLRRYGFVYLGMTCLGAVMMLVPALSRWMVLVGMVLSFLVVLVLLRPLGSNLLGWSLKGRRGTQRGDLYRALSVLPLKRETILRGIYAYTAAAAAAIWFVAVVLVVLRLSLKTGSPAWSALWTGDFSAFAWPALLFIPCAAGFIVATAAGHRALYIASGSALLAMLILPTMVLNFLDVIYGKGSIVPGAVTLVILSVAALTASIPPLTLLRRT